MKKIPFLFFLTCFYLNSLLVLAQTPEQETRYQNGRALIDQKKYDLAMAELLPLTNAGNVRQPEASYLYAVAASKANKIAQANTMLQQLISTSPEWGNIEEAYYLIAKLAFDQKDYEKALTNLQVIESEFIKPDAQAMERSYLYALADKNRFKILLQSFPNDAVLAKTYADKLLSGWYSDEDKKVLEDLVKKFDLDRSVYNPGSLKANRKKGEYNVAVLLPFSLNADAVTKRKNQFAADLYAGIKMAQDSLARNNIKINLFAYEANTDTTAVNKVFALPEMKTMDLVIGPVYKATAKQTSRFARKNQINVINPLSEDLEVVNGNPNLFLFESSVVTRAQQAANFAYENFENKTGAVIFENTKDDTLFARAYRKQYELRGGKIKVYKKVNTIKNPNVMAIYQNIDLKNLGHLMVASDNLPAAVATTSQVESKNTKLPIITKESWLEMPQLSIQQLDALDIYFIYPKYVNPTSASVRKFRRAFTSNYNVPPSHYAQAGFEMMYQFGNILNAYGPKFNGFLPQMPTVSGTIIQGLDYRNSRDNQYVPILKLEEGLLQIMNPVIN